MNKTILEAARNAILWNNLEDEKDHDGRYWLSAYRGSNTHVLIVNDERIVGSIPGGYSRSIPLNEPCNCTTEEWIEALNFAIQEKINGKYRLVIVDGSGTYFYHSWRLALLTLKQKNKRTNMKRKKSTLRNIITGEEAEVHSTTEHPCSSHGIPVWVDEEGIAYTEVGRESPYYEIVED